jgi:tetratricopeptide (TPR) repeat protein
LRGARSRRNLALIPVKKSLLLLLRWSYLALVIFCAVYLAMEWISHTDWYKDRIYHQLLTGSPQQQLRAASSLARLDGQAQLLEGLKTEIPAVRELARRALEHIWFNCAGDEAYELIEAAFQASEKEDYPTALTILNRLVGKYPRFAEGWNRRASVYWHLSQYEKSIADSEHTLALNPNHYGAWQGIGVCRLQLGDIAEACRCLRAALKIIPYDEKTRDSLERCEELLRLFPHPTKKKKEIDLIMQGVVRNA